MEKDQKQIEYARMLISRLERLSVDSWWAHRSSGLRGSLIRAVDRLELTQDPEVYVENHKNLDQLIQAGSYILEHAAREIRVGDPRR
jgi:hypothetical protein